jgi:hypothetical protein
VRVERKTGTTLLLANASAAGIVLIAPWSGTLIGDPIRSSRGGGPAMEFFTFGWVFPLQAAAVAACLVLLTGLEYAGIRFIAARRGWRLTRAGAWQVCCHASVGWIVMAMAPLVALAVVYTVGTLFQAPLGRQVSVPSASGVRASVGTVLGVGLPVLALFGGLFVYEWLVHVGVRRCRYAASLP